MLSGAKHLYVRLVTTEILRRCAQNDRNVTVTSIYQTGSELVF